MSSWILWFTLMSYHSQVTTTERFGSYEECNNAAVALYNAHKGKSQVDSISVVCTETTAEVR